MALIFKFVDKLIPVSVLTQSLKGTMDWMTNKSMPIYEKSRLWWFLIGHHIRTLWATQNLSRNQKSDFASSNASVSRGGRMEKKRKATDLTCKLPELLNMWQIYFFVTITCSVASGAYAIKPFGKVTQKTDFYCCSSMFWLTGHFGHLGIIRQTRNVGKKHNQNEFLNLA